MDAATTSTLHSIMQAIAALAQGGLHINGLIIHSLLATGAMPALTGGQIVIALVANYAFAAIACFPVALVLLLTGWRKMALFFFVLGCGMVFVGFRYLGGLLAGAAHNKK